MDTIIVKQEPLLYFVGESRDAPVSHICIVSVREVDVDDPDYLTALAEALSHNHTNIAGGRIRAFVSHNGTEKSDNGR